MSRFVIYVTSSFVGYLGSVAQVLSKGGHDVHCIVKSADIAGTFLDNFGLEKDSLIIRNYKYTGTDPIKDCLYYENKYREKFAKLCSYDRGLGKGYILNADTHPDQRKSYWSKDRRYAEILSQFEFFDKYLTKVNPDIVFCYGQSKILALVSRDLDISYRALLPPRWKNYYFWAENEFDENKLTSSFIEKKQLELQVSKIIEKEEENDLVFAKYFISKIKFNAIDVLKNFIKYAVNDTKKAILFCFKPSDGYSYLSWAPYFLTRYRSYQYIKKVGLSVSDLKKNKYILFPLQTEPESSLLYASPDLNNSLELIVWISKNLPSDMLLVVKEHPYSFGVRPINFYKKLIKMPNVVIANHKNHSTEWIDNAACIATITGTMGFEAVYHLRPVLSFGRYQLINGLQSVKYADSFNSTRKALEELLLLSNDITLLSIAKATLKSAIEHYYFQLDGFEETIKNRDKATYLAEITMKNFFKTYPEFS